MVCGTQVGTTQVNTWLLDLYNVMVTRPISMFDWLISVILSSLWSTVTGALTVWLHFVTGEDWTPVLCWWGCYSIDGSYGYSKTYQTCFHFKRVLLDLIESLAQKLLLVFNGWYSCFWLQRGRGGSILATQLHIILVQELRLIGS